MSDQHRRWQSQNTLKSSNKQFSKHSFCPSLFYSHFSQFAAFFLPLFFTTVLSLLSPQPKRHLHPDQRGPSEPQAEPERLEDPRVGVHRPLQDDVLSGFRAGWRCSLSRQLDYQKQREARQHPRIPVERLLLRGQQRQTHPERRRSRQEHWGQLGGEAHPGWTGGVLAAVHQPASGGAVLQQLQGVRIVGQDLCASVQKVLHSKVERGKKKKKICLPLWFWDIETIKPNVIYGTEP